MENKIDTNTTNSSFIREDGKPYEIPVEGSLGLLAYGYQGLMAWREKRKQEVKKEKGN